jgi:hypothetical protein
LVGFVLFLFFFGHLVWGDEWGGGPCKGDPPLATLFCRPKFTIGLGALPIGWAPGCPPTTNCNWVPSLSTPDHKHI